MPDTSDQQQLATLLEVGELLGSASNFEQALYEILEVLHERLEMRRGTLSLLQGDQEEVAIDIAYGLSQDEMDRGRYKVGEGVTGRVVETGEPAVVRADDPAGAVRGRPNRLLLCHDDRHVLGR